MTTTTGVSVRGPGVIVPKAAVVSRAAAAARGSETGPRWADSDSTAFVAVRVVAGAAATTSNVAVVAPELSGVLKNKTYPVPTAADEGTVTLAVLAFVSKLLTL